MACHRGLVYVTMGDVEIYMMAVDSREEGLPGFSHMLETTPPALYAILRKIRESRWIRTLKTSWLSGMNL